MANREATAPPVGDVIARTVVCALRRLGRRWSVLAAGRRWERALAASVAIFLVVVACGAAAGIVYGLINAPNLVIAAGGLIVFSTAFLRYVWWGFRP